MDGLGSSSRFQSPLGRSASTFSNPLIAHFGERWYLSLSRKYCQRSNILINQAEQKW
ncbi:hypothetical protein Scep_013979 [Stephania cephalantha]|uniref:Uncharacterized protein n=1 Tax=Stephania cephalantha TaxID=152367 RepID=A0AAP0J281_9MAGN